MKGTMKLLLGETKHPQSQKTNDWRQTAIFHVYIKINDKVCKVIIHNGSCINVVSIVIMSRFGL